MPMCIRRISTACIIVLASITGACADANLTGLDVPEQPAHSVSIAAATAWTASGPGTVTVVSDGTAGDAVMTYSLAGSISGLWDFETTADQTATVILPWSYTGVHDVADGQAVAEVYAIVNDVVVATLLVSGVGGSFSFSGTYTFTVSAGDTYGFRFGGFSEDLTLTGTFTVDLPEGPVDPATKDDCKNGGWGAYGFQNQGQCVLFVETGDDSR
jgi:hypothetical protein